MQKAAKIFVKFEIFLFLFFILILYAYVGSEKGLVLMFAILIPNLAGICGGVLLLKNKKWGYEILQMSLLIFFLMFSALVMSSLKNLFLGLSSWNSSALTFTMSFFFGCAGFIFINYKINKHKHLAK